MGPGSVLALLILLVFVGYETIRFRELHQTCIRTQEENERLLHNVLCADAWQRSLHGPKQEELCRRAREENDRTPLECAWRSLWADGELNQLWVRVSTSYWLMFGLGAPALCTIVVMWFSNRNQAAARRDQRELFQEMAKALRPHISAEPRDDHQRPEVGSIAWEYTQHKPPRRLAARPSWQYEQPQPTPVYAYVQPPAAFVRDEDVHLVRI